MHNSQFAWWVSTVCELRVAYETVWGMVNFQ